MQEEPWMRGVKVAVTDTQTGNIETHSYVSSPDEAIVVPFVTGSDGVPRVVMIERAMPGLGEGKTGISIASHSILGEASTEDAARLALAEITPQNSSTPQDAVLSPLFPEGRKAARPWKYTDIESTVVTCDLPADTMFTPNDNGTKRIVTYTEKEFLAAITPRVVDGKVVPSEITDARAISSVLAAFLKRRGIPHAHPGFAQDRKIEDIVSRLEPRKHLETKIVEQHDESNFRTRIVDGTRVIDNRPQAQALGFRRGPDGSITSIVMIIEPSFAHKDGVPRGFLGLASGSIDDGVTPIDAAIKELREEAGAEPTPEKEPIPLTAGIHPLEPYGTVSSTAFAVEITGELGERAPTADESPMQTPEAVELTVPQAMYLLENGYISDVSTAVALYQFIRNVANYIVDIDFNKRRMGLFERAGRRLIRALGRKSVS